MHLAKSPLNQPLNAPALEFQAAQDQEMLEDLRGL
jgi:hypothetical protein